jgi:hypothetical protein
MAKQMLMMPVVLRETPTPTPIFQAVSSVAFAGFDSSGVAVVVVVEDKNADIMVVGTMFQPFRWTRKAGNLQSRISNAENV